MVPNARVNPSALARSRALRTVSRASRSSPSCTLTFARRVRRRSSALTLVLWATARTSAASPRRFWRTTTNASISGLALSSSDDDGSFDVVGQLPAPAFQIVEPQRSRLGSRASFHNRS